ncbi:MAG TPA: hypothetical protein VEH04_07020 [Verrucomicrobiae bacterium]|nr:hypothetical protein [Verrucomicrobiae bacterium]
MGRNLLVCVVAVLSGFPLKAAPLLISERNASFPGGETGDSDSAAPIISHDGRYVLFASAASDLLATRLTDLKPDVNVFLKDRVENSISLISVSASGGGGNGCSYPCGISEDGRYVVFGSEADNLVPGDTNRAGDVFMRDRLANATHLISCNGAVQGNFESRDPVMSRDAHYVAFCSDADNLAPGDTNREPDIFLADTQSGTLSLVSTGQIYQPFLMFPRGSATPAISPDGRYVAFFSGSTNLVPAARHAGELYIRDRIANQTLWASTNARALYQECFGGSNGLSGNPSFSGDGTHVVFQTYPHRSQPGPGLVLRFDIITGSTTIIATNALVDSFHMSGIDMNPVSSNAQFVAYLQQDAVGASSLWIWDEQTGSARLATPEFGGEDSASGDVRQPILSASGSHVAFISTSTNLTAEALQPGTRLYVRNLVNNTTRRVDQGDSITQQPALVETWSMDSEGRVLVFDSTKDDLAAQDFNDSTDIFIADLQSETIGLISSRSTPAPSMGGNGHSWISTGAANHDGSRIVFCSNADDLVPGDTNGVQDVFVRDMDSGTTSLISVSITGGAALGASSEPAISGDGRYVVFSSAADNLVPADFNRAQDIFLRDLVLNTTSLVSVGSNGVSFGSHYSFDPRISSDGRFVLFASYATNLARGSDPAVYRSERLYVRDLSTGVTRALLEHPWNTGFGTMTPDGRHIAFFAYPSGFGAARVHIWDTQAGARVYTNISNVRELSISPDGSKLAMLVGFRLNVEHLNSHTLTVVATNAGRVGSFSEEGDVLAYLSSPPFRGDVYQFDEASGLSRLVSRRHGAPEVGTAGARSVIVSPHGRFIVYRTISALDVPNDANGRADLVLFDRHTDTTFLVSASVVEDRAAGGSSQMPVFSGDGQYLFFQSTARDLSTSHPGSFLNVYRLRLPSAQEIVDLDGDKMDDQWETMFFDTADRDGTDDFDLDGSADFDEFKAGTNPTNALSVLRLTIAITNAAISVRWPATSSRTYLVQQRDEASSHAWEATASGKSIVGQSGFMTEAVSTNGQRMYRVLLQD